MIHKCPNCTTALIFNPATDLLECPSCRSSFSATEFTSDESSPGEASDTALSDDVMEMNVYSCTACGAEISVNGVESSTFCSYCGQPTIVFDRVSSAKKPQYIIPFSVTKDQAITAIRKHLSSGYFVPQEIKDFSIERIRGIYVPFWLYDIDYADAQYLKGEVKSGKHSYTYYYYRSADVTFHDLTLDASDQLSDESTQRLEPYDTQAMRPFESGYLSGFYADCFDTDQNKLQYIARQRSKELFDKEIEKSVNAEDIEILKSDPKSEITKSSYAMFPAWFMTFRYQDEPYTIMVNGQTSKVVGAVPYDKKKVTVLYWIIAIIATLILTPIMYFMITSGDSDGFETILYFGFGGLCMWAVGLKKIAQIKTSIGLSKAANMNHFVKDRQEG
nr:zinc ribbon domain-containing protein [Lachnospiraceae bacterium]